MTATKFQIFSSDGKTLEVDELTLMQSITLGNLAEALGLDSEEPIPVNNIDEATLKMVFEFCEHHKNNEREQEGVERPLTDWEKTFFAGMSTAVFKKVCDAANYLEVPTLFNCLVVICAGMLKEKTNENMRKALEVPKPVNVEIVGKKSSGKKTVAKKTVAKNKTPTGVKKATVKKTVDKKTDVKKTAAKNTTPTVVKKATVKKTAVKKTVGKKVTPKVAVRKTASKAAVKKTADTPKSGPNTIAKKAVKRKAQPSSTEGVQVKKAKKATKRGATN